jgi:hypothetical protein
MSESEANPKAESPKANPLPNVGDLLFVGVCQLLLFMRPSFIFSDGSTGWHLVTGNYILKEHLIPNKDILSYTFVGKAWVAYEWFSDMLMALLVQWGGLGLLALAVSAALAGLVLALYQRMRQGGTHFCLAFVIAFFGLLASANHWLVRPHIFTFWGVYLFYTRLEDFYRGKINFRSVALWLVPYMMLWVNSHPAFLLAYAITGLYFVATAIGALSADEAATKGRRFKECGLLIALLGGLFLASLANPYGFGLYHYIAEYLKGTAILAQTDEFKSPVFHGNLHAFCLEVLFVLVVFGLWLGGRRATLPSVMMTSAFAFLSLSAVRNIALFSIVVQPVLGVLYGGTTLLRGTARACLKPLEKLLVGFNEEEARSTKHYLPLFYVVVVASLTIFGAHTGGTQDSSASSSAALKADFDVDSQPSETLGYIAKNKLKAEEGLALDNWGGIIKYKLGMPVFIDDRADFYGEKFYSDYGIICEGRPGYRELLDSHHINWILFPKESLVVKLLKEKQGDQFWTVACEDKASVLLVRGIKN